MFEFIVVVVCLVLNAFLAAFEMAFVSVSKSRLKNLSGKGNEKATKLLKMSYTPERVLSVIQLGITLVGAIAAAVGGAEASDYLEPHLITTFGISETAAEFISLFLVVIPLTFFTVVFGELVPKTLALRSPFRTAMFFTSFVFNLDKLFAPVIFLFERSTRAILDFFFPANHKNIEPQIASIDLENLTPVHQKFLLSMAAIETKKIKDVMLPWKKAVKLDFSFEVNRVTRTVFESGHTRLPVCDGDKVLGILHTKEFLILRDSGETNWSNIVRSFYRVKEDESPLNVLRGMQERRSHMAIVFSKDDQTIGLVTMEDIIEEIIGDITDEDDDGEIRRLFASKTHLRRHLKRSQN